MIAAITNAFTYGLRAGVLTSLGIATGNLFHIALDIFGVTVLISTYPEVGVLISILGISYLAYMGVTRIRKGFRQKAAVNFLFLSALAWLFRKRSLTGQSFAHESTINIIGGGTYIIVALALLFPFLKP